MPDAWALAEAIPEALQELMKDTAAGDRRAARLVEATCAALGAR